MKKIAITLDAQVVTWAQVQAAEQNVSLSRYVGDVLRDKMRHSREYAKAMREALAQKPFDLKGPWEPYPTREDLYDRPVLRRR